MRIICDALRNGRKMWWLRWRRRAQHKQPVSQWCCIITPLFVTSVAMLSVLRLACTVSACLYLCVCRIYAYIAMRLHICMDRYVSDVYLTSTSVCLRAVGANDEERKDEVLRERIWSDRKRSTPGARVAGSKGKRKEESKGE